MAITRHEPGSRMSQAVVYGGVVYTAGQVARDQPGASITAQTTDVLAHVDRVLTMAGTDKSRALSVTVWLSDMATFEEMNAVYDAWVDPANPPARACVEARLASDQFKVEIAVIAAQ